MSYGLSFEVTIPSHVDTSAVIRLGERCAPDGWDGEMPVSEALQWAFTEPNAIAELRLLGVDWEVIPTGRNEE